MRDNKKELIDNLENRLVISERICIQQEIDLVSIRLKVIEQNKLIQKQRERLNCIPVKRPWWKIL